MELTRIVYVVSRAMPADERFGLTMQMRRAAVSVPSNIAEGYAHQSTRDYVKFLRIARGSLAELHTQLEIATSLEMLRNESAMIAQIEETDRVLQGLIRSLEARL
jgi:four helix bundle protein